MKNAHVYANEAATKIWKPTMALVLIGVPVTGLALVMTQPDSRARLGDKIAAVHHQAFHALETPYRYPFYQSLGSGDRNLSAQLQQVIGHHQERMRQYPDSALEQAALASAYLRMARLTGEESWYLLAEQTAQRSLAQLPVDNSEALAVLARVTEAKHDFAGALRLAAQIPNPKEALPLQVTSNLAMGKLNQASQAADALVDATLSMSAFTLQALVKTAQGKDQEALQSFHYALEVEEAGELSNSVRTRTLLGRFYYEQGQLQRADDLYREALQILPHYPPAQLNRAQLELRRGNFRAAERHYAQLLRRSPNLATVFTPLILRGQAQSKALQGDRTQAEARWVEAETQLRQSFGTTGAFSFGHRRDLARLLLERGHDQDVPEAIHLMQAEVKLRQDADTLGTYAWALSRANRWPEAQTVIQQALALGSRDAGLFQLAATIEQELGNASQAAAYRKRSQEIDPQFNDNARQVLYLGVGLGS
jgi:tetratricopeptide (TPR) repeat protein